MIGSSCRWQSVKQRPCSAGILGENLIIPPAITKDISGFVLVNVITLIISLLIFGGVMAYIRFRRLMWEEMKGQAQNLVIFWLMLLVPCFGKSSWKWWRTHSVFEKEFFLHTSSLCILKGAFPWASSISSPNISGVSLSSSFGTHE